MAVSYKQIIDAMCKASKLTKGCVVMNVTPAEFNRYINFLDGVTHWDDKPFKVYMGVIDFGFAKIKLKVKK